MRSLFPSTYDRADVLMSAGCSTFVSAALILVIRELALFCWKSSWGYSSSDALWQRGRGCEFRRVHR